MTARFKENMAANAVGSFIATGLWGVVLWLVGKSTNGIGTALATLVIVVAGVCTFVLFLIYLRYVGILGADRRRPAERRAYDALRNSLAEGNLAARLYARWLTTFLDAIDRLFGDAGMADRTAFPHAFWLKTPAPLWTAPALERCLLLALIYPIATILVVWAVSGHVGPAENALHLNPRLIAWQRWLAAAVFGFSMFALWCAVRETGWKRLVRTVIYIVLFVIAVYLWVTPAGPMIVGGANAASLTTKFVRGGGTVPPAVTIALAFFGRGGGGTAPPAVTIAVAFFGAVIVAGAIAVISAGLGALQRLRWEGAFLTLFMPGMILACLGAATWLSPLRIWLILGPLLLFLGLITLLNAPFDWFSLGLTRALLRRGLELGGWAPYFLAIVDAALAAGVIVVLTLAMVVGVQSFDAAGALGGGKAVLPLDALFDGIAANPWAPEYWWIYVLLVSTMIPSLANLGIDWTSLLRGLPGLPALLLRKIPAQGNVPKFDRAWIATVLTGQVAAGAALGIAAQALLVWVIIGHVMPFFGLELLDMARGVSDFNLPARVGKLFGVSL